MLKRTVILGTIAVLLLVGAAPGFGAQRTVIAEMFGYIG
jgi:hypothetical protein